MCLNIRLNTKPQIAKKDIICYKFVKANPEDPEQFITPYMDMQIRLGELYESEIVVEANWISYGLHSMASFEGIQHIGFSLSDPEYPIVECIIPKGATYYTGRFWGAKSYASNKLKYNRVINIF